ncbi:MAG: putative DNA methylase [Candidatus Uhrbacteria bacterium GW2011_GWA2_52_8d]|uniref:Putative DNA methylase n=1 Tax=Candidatus Uhrbacteria bacterium GW2011_GWA2_52_8d TaxID=1618979 RepID=A0A0G1XLG4_9BACT|nr:MAG: putative DNA methylase [Candidatus Uhrbacteria bacterium GW2011_GWA2_52_8d]
MIYFILGSHPELSIAEIRTVLGEDYRPVFVSDSVVVIEPIDCETKRAECRASARAFPSKAKQTRASLDWNLGDLQDRLAGIVKIGRIAGELRSWNKTEAADLIVSLASGAAGKNKISFGLSVYDLGDKKTTRFLERDLDQLGLEIKKRLKETGRPIRYVKGKEPRLSSAIVETNGLLESGGEFVILVHQDGLYIGQTDAIQNFKAWSDRDYGRPQRDAKSGMLPPKLARMMINLGGIDPHGATLLDPFCGSGTVLMESVLMGFETLIGSDISTKAIADTKTNMTWLVDRFNLTAPNLSLYTTAEDQLPSVYSSPVNLLVTEVFLGNPRVKTLDQQEARRLESELIPLFRDSFTALATLLKPTARAVIAFPAYKLKSGDWHRLPLTSLLESLGYKILDNHLYYRENQLVARDIYVLTRK